MNESSSLLSTVDPEEARKRNLQGLLFTPTGALLFGIVAAITKGARTPVLMFLLGRSITQGTLSFFLIVSWTSPGASLMDSFFGPSGTRGWLVFRAILYWFYNGFWWWSIRLMPLGDATAIYYAGTPLTAVFAYCLLGEVLGVAFFMCALMAFIGVILIVQPSFSTGSQIGPGHSSFGPILALLAMTTGAFVPISVRKLRGLHWTTIEHTTSVLGALVLSPLGIAVWLCTDDAAEDALVEAMTSAAVWVTVIFASVVEFLALIMQTLGYQRVKHTAVATLTNCIEVPVSQVLQGVLFSERSTNSALLGAALVVAGVATHLLNQDYGSAAGHG